MKSFTFSALVGAYAIVARATPQKLVPIFPIQNSTSSLSKPEPTATSCEPKCAVRYPQLSALKWVPESQVQYTEKILVATISTIITTSIDHVTVGTSTQTVYGWVPPEYELYRVGTDEAGTRIVTAPLTLSDGLSFLPLTYPTSYVDYFTEYHWEGVLPTHDKEHSPVCATATPKPANGILPGHPEYPQPKEPGVVNDEDLWGQEHVPLWVPVEDQPDKLFFDVAFPSESAFSYCESVQAPAPEPTIYQVPKFITTSTTVWVPQRTEGIIVIQPTATGWEVTSTSKSRHGIQTPHLESTVTGFESFRPQLPTSKVDNGIADGGEKPTSVVGRPKTTTPGVPPGTSSVISHLESSVPGFGNQPGAQQTTPPDPPSNNRPPTLPEAIASLINNNPQAFPPPQTPTPLFTQIPTIINGQSTTIPAFILPDSSATAQIGDIVTLNGHPTTLAAPPALFTLAPTTINGAATSIPVYIISGTSTATLGQTVTINGHPTVLAAPPPTFTSFRTTVDGVATVVPGYIISGSVTATLGETVVVGGITTVLATPTEDVKGAASPSSTAGGGGEFQGGGGAGFEVSLGVVFGAIGAVGAWAFGEV